MKLSILICRLPSRYAMWGRLQTEFWGQVLPHAGLVQVLSDDRNSVSIGEKRNRLLQDADGEYVCFFDDDDWPASDYIDKLFIAAESGRDCASLKGLITFDGNNPAVFEHSLKYKAWKTVSGKEVTYERYPNHLNMIKTSIAKQFKFPEINHGEDQDWSTQIHKSGLLKTEFYIPEVIYYYRYVTNKPAHEIIQK